jgi:hypothetical protein
MTIQLYHELVKNVLSILAQVQNYQLHLTQILLSILTTPSNNMTGKFSYTKTMEKKLKRRQRDEGKRRS